MYKQNKIGIRIEPCGTPNLGDRVGEDSKLPRPTGKLLSDRWDLNHSWVIPPVPRQYSKWLIQMLWSMVSNGAETSKSIRTATFPESVANNKSSKFFKREVSVPCKVLKPDWKTSKIHEASKNSYSWRRTDFFKASPGREVWKLVGNWQRSQNLNFWEKAVELHVWRL